MNNKLKIASKLSIFWHQLTQSSKNISNEHQHKSRLLNQITLLFIQIITVFLFIIILFPDLLDLQGTFTLLGLIVAIIILFSVFVINRIGYYYIAVWLLFVSTHILIYYNAHISNKPHLEIMYLILLPLIGILILDLRNVIILTGVISITFVNFQYVHTSDIPLEVSKDLSIFITVMNILVIFVSHWRNKIELETRQLFLEQEKSDLIRDLMTNMSHDLKTPLTIINSSLYLIEKLPDADKQKYHIDKAKNQVWRLEGYIQDMLTILRLEDKQTRRQEWVNFNEIITTIYDESISEVESKNLRVTLSLDNTISDLYTHKSDIYRMIQNLIMNAINYTLDEGEIQITTYEKSNNVYLIVKDTGIGLSQEDSKLIFERFYRADKARSHSTGGTGLGLSIVKRVVDMNGGGVSVDSDLNNGSTFTVVLPVKPSKLLSL